MDTSVKCAGWWWVAGIWASAAGDDVYATTRGGNTDVLSHAGLRLLTIDMTCGHWRPLPVVNPVVFAVVRARRSGAMTLDIHVEGLRAVPDALYRETGRAIYARSTVVYA